MSATGGLAGRAVVVTGAGSGIGEAAALLFAREGAAVGCVDLDPDRAERVAHAIVTAGGRAIGRRADVTDEEEINSAVGEVIAEFGTVDGLYANAGIDGSGGVVETSRDRWDRVIGVNLTAGFALYLLSDASRWVSGGTHVVDGAHSVAAYSASVTSLHPPA